jgi:hypothetical protein
MARQNWRTFLRDAPVVEVAGRKSGKRSKAASDDDRGRKRERRSQSGLMYLLGVGERRLARGLAGAASEYARRADASAGESRDGAVRDAIENLVRAQEHALRQIAKIPRDMTRSRDYRRGAKRLRRSFGRVAW